MPQLSGQPLLISTTGYFEILYGQFLSSSLVSYSVWESNPNQCQDFFKHKIHFEIFAECNPQLKIQIIFFFQIYYNKLKGIIQALADLIRQWRGCK